MRRIASHYIYWRKWYRMHYLELDAKGRLTGVYPLVQEIANTEFMTVLYCRYRQTLLFLRLEFLL